MNASAISCVLALCAGSALSQPLPPTVEDREVLRRVELHPPVGATVWRTPAPHELEWYIAYDATPLKEDAPEFVVRLVNNGRPVRAPHNGVEVAATLAMSLTHPDGTTRRCEGVSEGTYVYNHGRDEGLIRPGKPVARFRVDVTEHFGKLNPGVYVLRVSMNTMTPLLRARDDYVINDGLVIQLPPLRFEVVDHPVREQDSGELSSIALMPVTKADEISARFRGLLTNTLDAPIMLKCDKRFDPSWSPTTESPAFVYNAIERWTESGWLRDEGVGYCGTGMGEVTVAPGEKLPIALYSPRAYDRSPGIYRCVVTAKTIDGELFEFVTKPVVIELRE
jgi:hypothetical protein